MGVEYLGLLISNISVYKSIDENYFLNMNSNGYHLLQSLSQQNYSNGSLKPQGRQFFVDLFNNFICINNHILNLDDIKRKIYILDNLELSVKNYFLSNSLGFTKEEIQDFYRHSYSLLINLKTLSQYIEYKEQSLNEYEFEHINTLQNNLRDYIVDFFFDKYFMYLSENKNLIVELQQIDQISRIIKPTTIRTISYNIPVKTDYICTYDKKKTKYFDYIDYSKSSQFFEKNHNDNQRMIHLYSFNGFDDLVQIKEPIYSHNMLAHEATENNTYAVNFDLKKYHIKYDSNGMREKDIYNIFIYGYQVTGANKKCLVGFSFFDNTHYENTYHTYISYFHDDIVTRDLFQDLEFEYNTSDLVDISTTSYQTVLFDFKNRTHDYDETRLLVDTDNSSYTFLVRSKFYQNKTLGTIQFDLSDLSAPVILETSGLFRNFVTTTAKTPTVTVLDKSDNTRQIFVSIL